MSYRHPRTPPWPLVVLALAVLAVVAAIELFR